MGVRMRYGATVTTDNRSTHTETDGQTVSQVVETTLWENENTGIVAFASQTIPLLQPVTDFDYIRVYWRFQQNDTSDIRTGFFDMDVSQYDTFNVDHNNLRYFIGDENPSGTNYMRSVYFNEDSITFGTAKQYNSTTTANTHAIPERVTGISKSEIAIPSRGNELITVLWVNQAPNSAMAASTAITLSDGIENYDFIRVLWKSTTTDAVDVNSWADWYIGKDATRLQSTSENEGIAIEARSGGTNPYVRTMVLQSTTAPFNSFTFSNGSRIANTTTNTSYVIPLIVCGVNYVDGTTERISNNFTVATTDWSSETVVYHEECYYADITITEFDGKTPVIYITSDDEEIPVDSQKAFIAWKYATVDTTALKLRLYAPTVPEAEFTIHVEGVR